MSQGTTGADLPLELGLAAGPQGEVLDLIRPDLPPLKIGVLFNFCFIKFSQKSTIWGVCTQGPHF